MKKTIALILAMLVCLGGFACASEEDEAFNAACALLEAGDYDGAIAAFSSIGRYQEIAAKIAEAQSLKDAQNAGFLYGTWINLCNDYMYTFAPGGEGHSSGGNDFLYTCEDGMVKITQPWMKDYEIVEINGIIHLQAEGYDLIREADYAVAGPKTVEITMENWETYFEVREAIIAQSLNAFGEFEMIEVGYGVFLRPEYEQRVANLYDDVQVSFKCFASENINESWYVEFNAETLELTVGEPAHKDNTQGLSETINTGYSEMLFSIDAKMNFAEHIVAPYTRMIHSTDEGLVWWPIEDFAITNAAGTLKMLP